MYVSEETVHQSLLVVCYNYLATDKLFKSRSVYLSPLMHIVLILQLSLYIEYLHTLSTRISILIALVGLGGSTIDPNKLMIIDCLN